MKQLFSIVLSLVLLVLSVYSQGTFLPTSIVNGTWVNGSVTAFNSPGALATNALVGYWKMDEASGNCADSSGHGWTGVPTSGMSYAQSGVIGTSINGNGSRIATTYSGAANPNFSVSFWVKGTDAGNGSYLLSDHNLTPNTGWAFVNRSGGGMAFVLTQASGGNTTYTIDSTPMLFNSQWNNVVLVVSNTYSFFIYTNGVIATTFSNLNRSLATSDNLFLLGDYGYVNGFSVAYANGTLDEIGYWATNLTPAQIQYLAATNPFSKF